MDKQEAGKWILKNKYLINRAIRSTNLPITPDEYYDLLQNAYCEILEKSKYYVASKKSSKFSTYIYKVIRNSTRRYYWHNHIAVSLSQAIADTIISEIIKRRNKNDGVLTDADYEEIREKKSFSKDTVNIVESLIDKTPYSDDVCELIGLKSRYSIDRYEEKIDQEYITNDLIKHLEKLPKAYQKALCEKYSLPIPDKHSPDISGSKCNNKYHLAFTGLKKLREMYKDKNIGDYIDE